MQMRKVLKNEFLTKKTIKHLMNKIFSTNTEKNEKDMQNFRKEYNLQSGNLAGVHQQSSFIKLFTLDENC